MIFYMNNVTRECYLFLFLCLGRYATEAENFFIRTENANEECFLKYKQDSYRNKYLHPFSNGTSHYEGKGCQP